MGEALNALETAVLGTLSRRLTMDEFLATLTASQIVVPSATEVQADGSGLAPLTHMRDGFELVVVFTHPDRIGASLHAQAPYQLEVDARWIIEHLALDLGLLLFAGPDQGIILLPHQLADLRARL